jgi:ribokinase
MVRIAVLASFNMDLVMRVERAPRRGETVQGVFETYLGGKGFNQAVAARRLGAAVAVTGRVGDDEYGRRFLDTLDREGIDRRAVVVDREHGTGVATIIVEPDGANTIVQSPRANWALSGDDVTDAARLLAAADVALLNRETSDDAAVTFAEAMHAAGARVVFNAAPVVGRMLPEALARLPHVIVANELETEHMLGIDPREPGYTDNVPVALHQVGISAEFVITFGAGGAAAVQLGHARHVPAFDVPVVDTTGAGDAFCAGLAVALAEDAPLEQALRFANAAGAVACTRAGAEPAMPYRTEVEALLAKGVTR